jgi:thioredoxin reductase (NADPH)
MTVISSRETGQGLLADALRDEARIVVVSLCAAWCDTCNEFRSDYERLAADRPDAAFVWLDIEDDSNLVGDVDVENFPTLAVFAGAKPLHFGVSLPHASSIGRLIDALAEGRRPLPDAPPALLELRERLMGARK